jgi:branched-chain amino acid transport system substrate-binding protein
MVFREGHRHTCRKIGVLTGHGGHSRRHDEGRLNRRLASNLALIRDLNEQSERASSADAITFEGLESYVHLRLVVEALRRADPYVDAATLQKNLAEITSLDLGGFRLSFRERPRNGSEWMEIGMRSRTGRMLR